MKTVTAKLGKTTYEAEKFGPGIVKLRRHNVDGTVDFHVPTELLIGFIAELKREQSKQVSDNELLGLKP